MNQTAADAMALEYRGEFAVQRTEFGAHVQITGLAVCVFVAEDAVLAVHGVCPGGVVGFGTTVKEACADHSRRLGLLFDDLQAEAASYADFERLALELLAYESPWARGQFDQTPQW